MRLTRVLNLRMTDAQFAALHAVASLVGRSVSDIAREAIAAEAGRILADPSVAERMEAEHQRREMVMTALRQLRAAAWDVDEALRPLGFDVGLAEWPDATGIRDTDRATAPERPPGH